MTRRTLRRMITRRRDTEGECSTSVSVFSLALSSLMAREHQTMGLPQNGFDGDEVAASLAGNHTSFDMVGDSHLLMLGLRMFFVLDKKINVTVACKRSLPHCLSLQTPRVCHESLLRGSSYVQYVRGLIRRATIRISDYDDDSDEFPRSSRQTPILLAMAWLQ
jgi:hypothetical protein